MPRTQTNNNETIPIEQTPVETGSEQGISGKKVLIGALGAAAVIAAGGLIWNSVKNNGETALPTPMPTPAIEVTATPRATPSPEAVEPYPTLGPDEYMTKGGLIMKIATPSASPRK